MKSYPAYRIIGERFPVFIGRSPAHLHDVMKLHHEGIKSTAGIREEIKDFKIWKAHFELITVTFEDEE